MKNYRKVQKIINSKFPDLMELKFGCELATEDGYFTLDSFIKVEIIYEGTQHEYRIFKRKELTDKEILGQPVTLQSLLRYLQMYANNITVNGDRLYINMLATEGEKNAIFDLILSPQEWSEEKWGEILKIINNK